MSTTTNRYEAAMHAVSQACEVCRRVQQAQDETARLLKDDRSPVSIADYASQAVIAHRLREELGGVSLVAEEDAADIRRRVKAGDTAFADAVLDATRVAWPEATLEQVLDAVDLGNAEPKRDGLHGFWTLDPIDGTKGFLRGEQYAVSLAWIEGGDPIIGVVGCPNLSRDFSKGFDGPDAVGSLYGAINGDGVWEYPANDPKAESHRVHRLEHDPGEPVRMCESVESAHASHEDHARILQHMESQSVPARLDSQAKYVVVARGQADLYLRLPRPPKPGSSRYVEKIWDHAAGALVASEAGCSVTDIRGNMLDFSHGVGLEKNVGVVVGPPVLHGNAIEAIRALGIGADTN
jgi:HAL2 family 3'(2'),5'-bisphosphate nucleotidase